MRRNLAWVFLVVAPMAIWGWTGCESSKDGIAISPGAVTIGEGNGTGNETTTWPSVGASTTAAGSTAVTQQSTNNNINAVVFYASTTALPLTWSVSNTNLGSIVDVSGQSATYVRNPSQAGDNIITVQDQIGNTGTAAITQL